MPFSIRLDHEPVEQPQLLLVDDDAMARLLTATALRHHGFEVTVAESGPDALARLEHWRPDLIVLDAVMPGQDGFETCRLLRARPGLAALPVLMLTGLEDEASIEQAYQAGATDFFVKSTRWALLAGRLRHLLRATRIGAELERKRSELARAQQIARIGSVAWRCGRFGLHTTAEALHVLGLPADARLDLRHVLRRLEPAARRALLAQLREALAARQPLTLELHLAQEGSRELILHVEVEPQFDLRGALVGYAGIVQDVGERRAAEDRIHQLAHFDALTGLPNRRELIARAERAIDAARREGEALAVLLIGLDRVKLVNDTLGHAAGDELLRRVAFRLQACVRHGAMGGETDESRPDLTRHDDVLGRLGGDEFVVLLNGTGRERDACAVAQRLQEALRAPLTLAGQDVFVTASIGVALFPRDGATVPELLRHADAAMRATKEAGRNAVTLYHPTLAGGGREQLQTETALHMALARGELVLHYQPKIDLRSGRVAGVEALMRWQRGERLVPPADFIPLAEETGLIVPMSEWALREAARQAAAWRGMPGLDGPVAVNLPSRLFERSDLVATLSAAAEAAGVPQGAVQIEITETGLMKDLQTVIPTLHRLHAIGVGLAIDDFGTGYSSLAYLTTLPIDELKIDRSFIRDLGVTPQSAAVIAAIVALARALSLRVVAEGVETLGQLEALLALGCDSAQGYLMARPMAPQALQAWVEALGQGGAAWQCALDASLPEPPFASLPPALQRSVGASRR